MREKVDMRKICIIHFVDIERYPPAINLLRYLNEHAGNDAVIDVLTIAGELPAIASLPGINIHRLANWKESSSGFSRMLLYLKFNLLAILKLLSIRPDVILYFETLSSGPAWFYKTFIRGKTSIYVHYHEYVSKTEYANGMVLSRWLHQKEKKLYRRTTWVSHTNQDRLSLFLKDLNGSAPPHTYIVPNYPPASWKNRPMTQKNKLVKLVYIGALSLETMYVREICEFVLQHRDRCSLDIYSSNVSDDARKYLVSLPSNIISYHGGVNYDELPRLLPTFDIGLVLYHGHIPNYVYNIPNKLFEYHVCGLDVWFPSSMTSALPYQTINTYPKIIAIDFTKLESIDLGAITERCGLHERRNDFSYEDAVKPLAHSLIGKST
jgi:hypothetical protein